jgi:hypothetical protein
MRVQRVLPAASALLFLVSLGFGQTRGRTEHFEVTIPVVGQELGSCGSFDLLTDYIVTYRGVIVFDKEGQSVIEVDQLLGFGQHSVYYNSEYPDLSLSGGPGEVETDRWYFEDGTLTSSGLTWKVIVPGYGPVFMESGRVVLDFNTGEVILNTGHNQYFEGDLAAICSFLTP